MKAMMRRAAAPKSAAPEIYFSFPGSQRGVIPYFFALSSANSIINIANKEIHYFSRNNDFNGDLTCVRGMKAPAAPCRATCISGSLPYFFKQFITGTFFWVHFY